MWFRKVLELLSSEGSILSLLVDGEGEFYLEIKLDTNYGVVAFKTDRGTVIDFMQNLIPFERLLERSTEHCIYTKSGHFYVPVDKKEIQDIPVEYGGFRYSDFNRTMRETPDKVFRQLAEM